MNYRVWGGERRFALEHFETESESQRISPLPVEDMNGHGLLRGAAG